jgi:hypothetical protein
MIRVYGEITEGSKLKIFSHMDPIRLPSIQANNCLLCKILAMACEPVVTATSDMNWMSQSFCDSPEIRAICFVSCYAFPSIAKFHPVIWNSILVLAGDVNDPQQFPKWYLPSRFPFGGVWYYNHVHAFRQVPSRRRGAMADWALADELVDSKYSWVVDGAFTLPFHWQKSKAEHR